MRETEIEKYLVKQSKIHGGKCYKFVSPQNSGVPDRILLIKGYTIFIETKAPNGKPRPLQKKVHQEMREYGALVMVINTKEQVDDLFNDLDSRRWHRCPLITTTNKTNTK